MSAATRREQEALRVQRMLVRQRRRLEMFKLSAANVELKILSLEQRARHLPAV